MEAIRIYPTEEQEKTRNKKGKGARNRIFNREEKKVSRSIRKPAVSSDAHMYSVKATLN